MSETKNPPDQAAKNATPELVRWTIWAALFAGFIIVRLVLEPSLMAAGRSI